MKAKICSLLIALVSFADVEQAVAQLPVITSFSQNGLLVCSNLAPNSVASVEWASSVAGPWYTNWAALAAVPVSSNGTIITSVPMFYRVRGLVSSTNAVSTNAVPSGMALIPAGAFTMGDTLDGMGNALPISVNISSFYMDTNLVSKAQWDEVYAWAISHGYSFDHAGTGKGANHPVQTINWWDSVKWSNARSEKENRTPAYYTDAGLTMVYRGGQLSPTVKWNSTGYRLPTEAEWEKAARGGLNQNRFPWGNTISRSQANYYGNTGYSYDLGPNGYNPAYTSGGEPYTSPVGSFAPNGYGLYDMAGNVWQWCWDWYLTPYAGGSDPHGPVGPLSCRVLRGGAWVDNAGYARAAGRDFNAPNDASGLIGFRCVRGL